MSRQFDLRFRLTLDDYVALSKAYRELTRRRRISRYFVYAVVLISIVLSVYHASEQDWVWATYFGCIAAVLLLLEYVVTPYVCKRQFREQRLGEHEIEVQADEQGFATTSALAAGQMKWSAILKVSDLPNHVLLWSNPRLAWIVPKRAFNSAQSAEAFAQLAMEKTAGQKL